MAKKKEITQVEIDERASLEAQKRIELGVEKPIEYYYVAGESRFNSLEYVEIRQVLNDKFNGNLSQAQFFAVAEQTRRIYLMNKLLIEKMTEDSLVVPKVRFMIQISAKWLTNPAKTEVLENCLSDLENEAILAIDAVSLAGAGVEAKDALLALRDKFKIKILLDNVEYLNFMQFVAYHADYVRIDARFIDMKDDRYEKAFKFVKDFTKAVGGKVSVKHVSSGAMKEYFLKNGADVLEGRGVSTPKKQIVSILSDYKRSNVQ